MNRLTIVSRVCGYSSYGILLIQFTRWIEKLTGAYVSIRPISVSEAFGAKVPADIRSRFVSGPQPEEWELLFHPPNSFCPTPGKKTAWFTLWESTMLPSMGVNLLNKASVVITANAWNASCFSACGVTAPIRVIPLGVDPTVFQWRPVPQHLDGLTIFGTAGRMAHGGVRKGINEVIDLFQRAFPTESDVRLRVKCFDDCPVTKPNDNRVEITQGFLTEQQMADWYVGIHCYVSAAKSEGWGLNLTEAMRMCRPCISINFGGTAEFFDSEAGYEIPWTLAPAQGTYRGCGHWAEPSSIAIIEAMRSVRDNPTLCEMKGTAAYDRVKHLTWEHAADEMVAVLREFGAL